MDESKLHKALLAAAEIIEVSESSNVNAMFDALVNLELISRAAVQEHLITTSLEPAWRLAAKGPVVYH